MYNAYLAAGQNLKKAKNYDMAIDCFKHAEEQGNDEAYIEHAKILIEKAQYIEAEEVLLTIAEKDNAGAIKNLIEVYKKQNKDYHEWDVRLRALQEKKLEQYYLKDILSKDYLDLVLNNIDSIPKYNVITAIAGAPISIYKKEEMFRRLGELESEELRAAAFEIYEALKNGKEIDTENLIDLFSVAERTYTLQALRVKEAIENLNCNENEVFMLKHCCLEKNEESIFSSDLVTSLDEVKARIGEEYDASVSQEELVDAEMKGLYWTELVKYVKQFDGKFAFVYQYTMLGFEPCWFVSFAEKLDNNLSGMFYKNIFNHVENLSLPAPYNPGDILEVDCRPFAPIRHCVVLSNPEENKWDCCNLWVLYVDSNHRYDTGAFNHGAAIREYTNAFFYSPIYKVKRIGGIFSKHFLSYDEKDMEIISNQIDGIPEVAQLYEDYITGCDKKGIPVDTKSLILYAGHHSNEKAEEYAAKTKCTMCGKPFTFIDMKQNISFDKHIGYGSKHDLEHIKMNLCCDCLDKVLDFIIPQCEGNLIVNPDYSEEMGFRNINKVESVVDK